MLDVDFEVWDNWEIYDSEWENSLREVFVVSYESVDNNLMASEVKYGLEIHCSREKAQQTADKHDFESGVLRKTTTIDDKLKKTSSETGTNVLRKSFSGGNGAGNVGTSHQQAKKVDLEHAA